MSRADRSGGPARAAKAPKRPRAPRGAPPSAPLPGYTRRPERRRLRWSPRRRSGAPGTGGSLPGRVSATGPEPLRARESRPSHAVRLATPVTRPEGRAHGRLLSGCTEPGRFSPALLRCRPALACRLGLFGGPTIPCPSWLACGSRGRGAVPGLPFRRGQGSGSRPPVTTARAAGARSRSRGAEPGAAPAGGRPRPTCAHQARFTTSPARPGGRSRPRLGGRGVGLA